MVSFIGVPEPYLIAGVIVLAAAAFTVPALVAAKAFRRDRRATLSTFAARHGLTLHSGEHAWDEAWYETFDLLARERPREQRNIMTGAWRGLDVAVLDYDYTRQQAGADGASADETSEGEPPTGQRTVVIAYLPWDLPGVIIEPNATNRLMRRRRTAYPRAYYPDDDAFEETSSFERRYVLLAEDDAAAGRLLHPEMETFLLQHWGVGVEIAGAAAVFFAYRLLRPGEIKLLLDFAARFCELIPQSLTARGGGSGGATS